jgi:hypothetical protein
LILFGSAHGRRRHAAAAPRHQTASHTGRVLARDTEGFGRPLSVSIFCFGTINALRSIANALVPRPSGLRHGESDSPTGGYLAVAHRSSSVLLTAMEDGMKSDYSLFR